MNYIGKYITKNPPLPSPTAAPGMWTLDDALQYQKAGIWPPGYQISRSVRLRAAASAYFNRTPASTTNRQIMTWSGWVKRGSLSDASYMYLFGAYPGTSATDTINFINGNLRVWFNGSTSADLVTTQVFRDPSAWYHIVVAIDTTQATASNRIKIYINGSQVTAFSTSTYPTQNYNTNWNNSSYSNQIGANGNGPASFFDGYMTEINFIDGQQLTPSSFGYTDTVSNVWQPLPYMGTYGTNGFYLNFSDNSSNTATTIGKDYSGNGNNWTPNNISVTAGTTYDSMVDSPTQSANGDTGIGGEVRGNYCVLNPLDISGGTVSNGNLTYVGPNFIRATITPTSGKYYWEVTVDSVGVGNCDIGLFKQSIPFSATTNRIEYRNDGNKVSDGSVVAYGATYTTNNIIGVAADFDNGTITFYKNNASQGIITYGSIVGYSPHSYCGTSFGHTYNFGQRAFAYTAPSGYKALCSTNLPTPTINNGANYMAATIYTGNGANRSISNAVNGVSFQPDFVWVKNRTNAYDHDTYDSLRPQGSRLITNLTNAEGGTTTVQVNSFNSDGFGLGTYIGVNESGSAFVGWQWKAGAGTTSTIAVGSISSGVPSIASTVSVNQTAGFSVATFTTQSSSTGTFGHGLGAVPSMVIIKLRAIVNDWNVYHTSIGATKYLYLDTTAAAGTSTAVWNDTAPTSSVVTLGTSWAGSYTAVAYCFAAIAGYSAFGSYTGNGSADGPFIYIGFRPRFVMFKRSDSTGSWFMEDSSRGTYNVMGPELYAESSAAEGTSNRLDFLSNGFKMRAANAGDNASGGTYVYACFAENPFKYARAR